MARFDTTGLDSLIRDMQKMGQSSGAMAEAMVNQAVIIIRDAWKESAEKHNLRDTGDMIASINFPNPISDAGGVLSRDVYPVGRDRKGVRNAEKAFILHYGTKRIPATYWVDDADEACAPAVYDKLEKMWGEYIDTGKVPTVVDTGAFTKTKK